MKFVIHGGKDEIGGNCIELIAGSDRLVLDMGLPVTADSANEIPLPDIKGLLEPSDDLLGVIVSHPHIDHYGLLSRVGEHVPVYMGNFAKNILERADPYMPFDIPKNIIGCLSHKKKFSLGVFEITPYLVDHSAYDSYALLVEANGKRLFYTGDIRGHGRKGSLCKELLDNPPENIDTLIIEGTRILPQGAKDTHGNLSEYDLENELVKEMETADGMVLVACSSQNIDRVVSVFKACLRSGRTLLIDLYTAIVLEATENSNIPKPGWNKLKVFVPLFQRVKTKKSGDFEFINRMKPFRVYPEKLLEISGESVLLFRTSMARDLEGAGCLEGARAVWSMWSGYLKKEVNYSGYGFIEFCDRNSIPWRIIHSSGHAPRELLDRLIRSIDPGETVFVHTLGGK